METVKDVVMFFIEIFVNDKFDSSHVIKLNESRNWLKKILLEYNFMDVGLYTELLGIIDNIY